MTIAAGFVTQEGFLLCADTQYTGGAKVQRRKIRPFTLDDGTKIVFALAGHSDYGFMAVEESLEAINKISPEKRTISRIQRLIRTVLEDVNRLIDACPIHEQDIFRFEFLVAVHRAPYRPALWVTRRTSIHSVESRECIGTGEYLAGYLLAGYEDGSSLKRAITLATRMLYILKRYDANVGGFSHMAVLRYDGSLEQQEWSMTEAAEKLIPHFEQWNEELLLWMLDPSLSDGDMEGNLARYANAMKLLRERWREDLWLYASVDKLTNIIDQYRTDKSPPAGRFRVDPISNPAEQPDPQSTKADQSPLPPSPESPGGTGES